MIADPKTTAPGWFSYREVWRNGILVERWEMRPVLFGLWYRMVRVYPC